MSLTAAPANMMASRPSPTGNTLRLPSHLPDHLPRLALRLVLSLFALLGAPALLAQDAPTFPPLTGRIVDAADLLPEALEKQLGELLAGHENETSNQVVVVTVPDLQGYDVADYALRLGRNWGIGTQEKDNGVILLVAPAERKVRIEVGYGLEGALTDSLSGQIIRREILPAFRENDYPGGIENGVNAIIGAINGEYTAEPETARPSEKTLGAGIMVMMLAIFATHAGLGRKGYRQAANALIPSGFAGAMAAVVTGQPITGIIAAIVIFLLVYLLSRGGGTGGSGPSASSRRRDGYVGTGGFGGGFGGGGGFSGGGGSFGGGGASGGW